MHITPVVVTTPAEGPEPLAGRAAVPCRLAAGPAVLGTQDLALWLAWYRSRWAVSTPGDGPPKGAHAASSGGALPRCGCTTPHAGAGPARWRCGRCGLRLAPAV